MLYLSGFSLIAGYGTNVLLARMGAATLGFYGLLLLIVSLINTFFVLGGSNVIVNFLPKIEGPQKREFLGSYAVLIVAFSSCCLGVFLLFPRLVELVFGHRVEVPVVRYMVILLPVLIAQFFVWGVLQAEPSVQELGSIAELLFHGSILCWSQVRSHSV